MRQGIWAIAACALLWGAPAHAQTGPAPTKDAPVVVAGVPVTQAQARARAGSRAGTYEVRETYTDLVQARFIAGEAALRGVAATPDDVRREQLAEEAGWGGEEAWRFFLKDRGIPEAEARAEIADRALAAKLTDAFTDAAHGDTRAWGASFFTMRARWRAQTTCSTEMTRRIPDWCGNSPPRERPCLWFGAGELCAIVTRWGGFVDLARTFYPGKVVATCDDEGERARHRLRVYLKRTAPRVLRRTSFNVDCGPQTFQTRYRSDIVVVFHAIARIAERVRRG
jgi:hypothetical protein